MSQHLVIYSGVLQGVVLLKLLLSARINVLSNTVLPAVYLDRLAMLSTVKPYLEMVVKLPLI